jgi:hypothetical protein
MTDFVLSLVLLATLYPVAMQAPDDRLKEADELFAKRDDVEKLRQAVTLAEGLVKAVPGDYEALWRLAKYRYYLSGREADKAKQTRLLKAGGDAAKKAVAVNTNRAEGHFWIGANAGELAALKGSVSSLGLIRTIRREFEAALAIDPNYSRGTTHLALGEMDLRLPRLLGGSERRGLQRLEAGLQFGPQNAELKLALAKVYLKKNRSSQARQLLEGIVADLDPLRTPEEMKELRDKARQLLEKAP